MTFKRRYAFFIRVYLKTPNDIHKTAPWQQDLAAMGLTGTETILIYSSMKAIGVVEGGADTVLDVCIAGAEFCKPIRMQRYLCGSGCTAGVFFVQVLSEKGKSWYTVLKKI